MLELDAAIHNISVTITVIIVALASCHFTLTATWGNLGCRNKFVESTEHEMNNFLLQDGSFKVLFHACNITADVNVHRNNILDKFVCISTIMHSNPSYSQHFINYNLSKRRFEHVNLSHLIS
jgi:hypothetical protein